MGLTKEEYQPECLQIAPDGKFAVVTFHSVRCVGDLVSRTAEGSSAARGNPRQGNSGAYLPVLGLTSFDLLAGGASRKIVS